jgi:hypothetical protein
VAAALEASSPSASVATAAVPSEHVLWSPCDGPASILVPHGGICERNRCGGLCVEQFMWKYKGIKAIIGDCTAENVHQCICSFLC